jgi:hypothetical protein
MVLLTFKNNCKTLPIIISSWVDKTPGLSQYIDVEVPPNTEVEVKSSDGDFMIGSLFIGNEKCNFWRSHRLPIDSTIAQYSIQPYSKGRHILNHVEKLFDLVYENGVLIWSYKHEGKSSDFY